MMRFRLVSDLHLDFDSKSAPKHVHPSEHLWMPASLPDDHDTVLVIAGDLWVESKFLKMEDIEGKTWLERVARRFKAVVFVLGNHDYWGCRFDKVHDEVDALIAERGLSNAHLLRAGRSVIVDGVKFIGDTLWTDFNNADYAVLSNAAQIMNDYKYARNTESYRKLKPTDVLHAHRLQRDAIFKSLEEEIPTVVVVHMAPSYQSVHDRYRSVSDEILNYLYFTELGNKIAYEVGPHLKFVCHGHMHNSFDYMIGAARVLCNPRGYGKENKAFDDTQIFVVDTP